MATKVYASDQYSNTSLINGEELFLINQSDITKRISINTLFTDPTFYGNVSGITKDMIGLGNVDNTSDINKPVSNATQIQLDLKTDNTAFSLHTSNTSNPHSVTKSQVGLGNVTNESKSTMFTDPTFTGNIIISSNSSLPALRITQEGIGDVIRVEDSTNPDITPFVINQFGDIWSSGNFENGGYLYTGRGVANSESSGIEIGFSREGEGISYIDFHSQYNVDCDFRIVRNPGANGAIGFMQAGIGVMTFNVNGPSGNAYNATEALRINSLGNIGIGTYEPSGRLDIKGSTTNTGISLQTQDSSGNIKFQILDSGNIITTSNTLVSNLNADLLDGNHSTYFTANTAFINHTSNTLIHGGGTGGNASLSYNSSNGFLTLINSSGTTSAIDTNVGSTDNVMFNTMSCNTSYVATHTESTGRIYWDTDNHTYSAVLENGVVLQLGQEGHIYAKNTSGVAILNGDACSMTSTPGSFTTIAPTDVTNANSALSYIGLATQDIAINAFGYVTMFGTVRDVNTNSYVVGLNLYVDPLNPGKLTQTVPQAGYYAIDVGLVEYKHSQHGRITVISIIIPKLLDLSDVNGTPLTANGQILVWNNTNKYWDAIKNINDYTTNTAFTTHTSNTLIHSGSDMGLVNTAIITSNTSSVDFINLPNSTYISYILKGSNIKGDPYSLLRLRYYIANTLFTTGYSSQSVTAGAYSTYNACIPVGFTNITNSSCSFTTNLPKMDDLGVFKIAHSLFGYYEGTSASVHMSAGYNSNTGPITGINISAAAGNITSGTFKLYGIK